MSDQKVRGRSSPALLSSLAEKAGNPELLFLHEPTAAMDPQARQITWNLISSLRARGVTLLLTTHFLEEAQRLADQVTIIDRGLLVAFGTPADLTRRAGGLVRFVTSPPLPAAHFPALPGAVAAEEEQPGVYRLESTDPDELLKVLRLQTAIEFRLLFRQRGTMFFGLVLPLMFLFFVGVAFRSGGYRGYTSINSLLPPYLVMAVMSIAVVNLGLSFATQRATGAVKRFGGDQRDLSAAAVSGGSIVPVSKLPRPLADLAWALPPAYLVRALDTVLVRGQSLASTGWDLPIVAAWGLASILAASRRLSWE